MRMGHVASGGPQLDFSGYNCGSQPALGASHSFDDDLDWLLGRLADALGAAGCLLTVHSDEGRLVSAVAGSGPELSSAADAQEFVARIATGSPVFADIKTFTSERFRWIEDAAESRAPLLCMALPSEYGAQVVLTGLFGGPRCREERAAAETKFKEIRPLLSGYFRLWRRHRYERCRADALASAIDLAGFAIILLDQARTIRHANAHAARLLSAGHVFRRVGKEIAAADIHESLRMHVAIDNAVAANAGGSRRDRAAAAPHFSMRGNGGGTPHIVLVFPCGAPAAEPADPAAILFAFVPGEHSARQIEPVCDLYGLSPVERRLAGHLIEGRSLAEAAKAMRLKDATTRSYLKQLFAKTGTHRQAELVRLLLMSTLKTRPDIDFITV